MERGEEDKGKKRKRREETSSSDGPERDSDSSTAKESDFEEDEQENIKSSSSAVDMQKAGWLTKGAPKDIAKPRVGEGAGAPKVSPFGVANPEAVKALSGTCPWRATEAAAAGSLEGVAHEQALKEDKDAHTKKATDKIVALLCDNDNNEED